MKLLLPQNLLIVGALALGLVACGAAAPMNASAEPVAKGPIAPPPPPPPPPTGSANADPTTPLPPDKLIVEKNQKELLSGDLLEEDARVDRAAPRGPIDIDPLAMAPVDKAAEGRGGQGFGSVASGAKGGSRPSAASAPDSTGTIGAATEVRGSIDKAEIQRVVKAHLNDVKRCYDQGLARKPDLEGKVVLKFVIGKTGSVVAATVQQDSTLNDRPVEQCIANAATRWTFPKPTGEGIVIISYPFILKSAG